MSEESFIWKTLTAPQTGTVRRAAEAIWDNQDDRNAVLEALHKEQFHPKINDDGIQLFVGHLQLRWPKEGESKHDYMKHVYRANRGRGIDPEQPERLAMI